MAASCAQLAYTNAFGFSGISSTLWPWYISAQCVQTVTIITSCAPYLRQLLEAFPSTMFTSTYSELPYSRSSEAPQSYILKERARERGMLSDSGCQPRLSTSGKRPGERQGVSTRSTARKASSSDSVEPNIQAHSDTTIGVAKTIETIQEPRST